jgi:hypothetical protein
MTGVPAGLWIAVFALVALVALAAGVSLLFPAGLHA